jgi:hypothetical protein
MGLYEEVSTIAEHSEIGQYRTKVGAHVQDIILDYRGYEIQPLISSYNDYLLQVAILAAVSSAVSQMSIATMLMPQCPRGRADVVPCLQTWSAYERPFEKAK